MSIIKQLGILVLLAGLAAGGHFGWQAYTGQAGSDAEASAKPKRNRPAPTVETAAAEIRDLETVAEAVGSTRARRAVEITPMAAGRVAEVAFQAGQRVAAGHVLVRLDDDIQRADVLEAKARVTEAGSALERARSLKRTSAVSDETVDRLVATLATATANLERAERRLRDRTIAAPFAGVVGFTRVEMGARLEDGDTVTTLDELSLIEIEFSLPERLFGSVRAGQRIRADASAFPERVFEGQIETIDSRIDPVSRAFKARAVVENPDLILPAGMFMHIVVRLGGGPALTIPEEAVVIDGSQKFVFSISKDDKGARATRREVSLGQRGFGFVEVLSGVADGDQVVTRGVQRVRDGGPVQMAGDRSEGGRGKKSGQNKAGQKQSE